MAAQTRLKQDLIREIVRDNRDVMSGSLLPRRVLRRRRARLGWFAAASAVAAILALAVAMEFRSPARARPPHRTAASVVPVVVPAISAPVPDQKYPAPAVIDPSVFRLAIHRIVIDPGHGGSDPGARVPRGVEEKTVTLDIAKDLAADLRKAGYDVVLTRERDEFVPLERRVELANASRADLFVSIHINSIPRPERLGVETYYLGRAGDRSGEALAEKENAGSGYSLSDFRKLLEEVYSGVRLSESERFARSLQRGLFSALHRTNADLADRGVKTAPLVVLAGTSMPAILAEVSCLSNREEAGRLASPDYRATIARALAEGIGVYTKGRETR